MPSNHPSRRNLLLGCAAISTGVLAGCTSRLPASDSTTGPLLHFYMERLGRSLVDHHVVDLEETRIEWDEEAFQAALNGSDYTTQYRQPFPVRSGDEPVYAHHEGTYYELDSVIVGEEQATHPVLRVFSVGRQGESDDLPEFTPREELPTIDQQAVQIAHMADRARGNEGGFPVGLVERGGFVYRSDGRESQSRLLSESAPTHVGHRDTVYRVEITTETFYEPVYRPDIDPVAESSDEMEAVLRGAFVDSRIDPESLTGDERQIVHNARGGGYEETHPFSDPLESLLRALDRREYIDGDIQNDGFSDQTRGRVLKFGEEYFDYHLRLEA